MVKGDSLHHKKKNIARSSSSRVDFERDEMIDLIRQRGVSDERLLQAMGVIDRREFVQKAFLPRAYDDSALPIGHSQTISQPYTVAFMTEALEVKAGDKVLEIGTGSGYQAAILAEMGVRVYTIERNMDLLNSARQHLDKLGYDVVSKCGDGTIGWKEFAPYDGIIVTAGAPEVPQPLLNQLKHGGRLVIPIGDMEIQNLHIIKRLNDKFETKIAHGFKFVPLVGKKGWK
ncbi:MAG: protein-L-isoaspartate(D-aspartate) O-methyltransferase [Bacteroidota bacterium]|nr:protein-L-isoaspartate(D-aspartate) O-methyltransferase [Bacteroidota bacterium]